MASLDKTTQPFAWNSFGMTDVGKARRCNEDSILHRPEAGIWVVADGMGGHAAGDVASQLIVSSLEQLDKDLALEETINKIEDSLLIVNKQLIAKAAEAKKRTTIGSTIVMMVTFTKYCVYFWAGDSRLYRLRDGNLRQMTRDHSQVEEYVDQGLMNREEAAQHPHGNMITRAVGASRNLFLDTDIQEMQAGDRYLLCSDGLTRHTQDFEFQDLLQHGSPEEICKEMIELTLERGARDNVTAVVIDITSNH